MLASIIKSQLALIIAELYGITAPDVIIEPTKPGFTGDYTFVVFPFLKQSRKGPEQTAEELGKAIVARCPEITAYNVVKGFLNMTVTESYWTKLLSRISANEKYGIDAPPTGKRMLVEYSSPNTNKPLHLGHVRNIFLGYAVSQILKANGHEVFQCNLVNDRGIHICKSMLAWQRFGNGETPESSGIKGDHLVGKYYVIFDQHYKQQMRELQAQGMPEEDAARKSPLMLEAQEMLRKWEAGDQEVVSLWKTMNEWVYAGFEVSYKNLGVRFDKYYYESNTYLLGKDIVKEGLAKGVFYSKDDGSVWIDLTADGLDQKLLLRADGTSVYITQDVGTAEMKFGDFSYDKSIYVVGNEQDYHFKVLKLICEKLQKPYAGGIYHLSYGMVELPHGKMKSREGTVVDADDLMAEMVQTAGDTTRALGKTEGLSDDELNSLYQIIGMGALKYFLLKVEPRKKMLFNPAESIDFHGNTGPFIQYTYARIRSIMRNAGTIEPVIGWDSQELLPLEKDIIRILYDYPNVVKEAGEALSPGLIANYIYDLAKTFSHFYHELSVLHEKDTQKRYLRLMIASSTAKVIRSGFGLMGIEVPERM